MTELTFTGNIRRLRLRPDDVIVVETPNRIQPGEGQFVLEQLKELFPTNPSVLLANGLRIASTLRPKDAQNLSDLPDPSNRSTGA